MACRRRYAAHFFLKRILQGSGHTAVSPMGDILDMNTSHPLPYELTERLFPDVVVRSGAWEVCCYGVHDDGSCWWHSLAMALDFEGAFSKRREEQIDCGHRLRALVRDTITDEATWQRFWTRLGVAPGVAPSAASVRAKLADNAVWSDFFICVYSFSLVGANAMFIDMQTGEPYCGVTHDARVPRELLAVCGTADVGGKCARALARLPNAHDALIVVAWKQYAHFEPIVMRHARANALRDDERARADVYERAPQAYVARFTGKIARALLARYRSADYCANITLAATATRQRASVHGGALGATARAMSFLTTHGRLTRAVHMTRAHALGAGPKLKQLTPREKKSARSADPLRYDDADASRDDHARRRCPADADRY